MYKKNSIKKNNKKKIFIVKFISKSLTISFTASCYSQEAPLEGCQQATHPTTPPPQILAL